ncbi:MAG: hypothetical protein HYR63_23300 [Proteobacteria bacterium]|nr:hypothetical protein [Pseudomonadota bacterium]MBI3497155.1 hypothetical protein [Pseudomonadota bacterium]
MPFFTESVLVIDNSRKFDSLCVNALSSLGYRDISHATFEDGIRTLSSFARFDAVVGHWDNDLPASAVSTVIRSAMSLAGCEGALVISPFCTSENIRLFRRAGVCAWVSVPFTQRDLDARLRYALEGERRRQHVAVPIERRQREPMPAFA